MTYSTDSKIRLVQKVELELLKEVQDMCNRNNIHFYLRGGSVMGAVKYQGFVPWDDDTDIAIPRPDFKRFVSLFTEEWSDKYWLANSRSGDPIHTYFPRFLLTEDYRMELGLPANNHLGFTVLDVLPLDGVPSNMFLRKMFEIEVYFFRLLGAAHTVDVKDSITQHTGMKKKIITAFNKLGIQRLYSQEWTYEQLDRIYMRSDLETSKYSGTITGSSLSKELFPQSVWGKGVFLPFEDLQFRVPSEYDTYLRQIYGEDYLTVEPEKKKKHFSH